MEGISSVHAYKVNVSSPSVIKPAKENGILPKLAILPCLIAFGVEGFENEQNDINAAKTKIAFINFFNFYKLHAIGSFSCSCAIIKIVWSTFDEVKFIVTESD